MQEKTEDSLKKPLKSKDEMFECSMQLIDRGINTVLVSMGTDGALMAEKEEAFKLAMACSTACVHCGSTSEMDSVKVYGFLDRINLQKIG